MTSLCGSQQWPVQPHKNGHCTLNGSLWPFLTLPFKTRVLTSKSVTAATHFLWVVRSQSFHIQGWVLKEHQSPGNEQEPARRAVRCTHPPLQGQAHCRPFTASIALVRITPIMLTLAPGTQCPNQDCLSPCELTP